MASEKREAAALPEGDDTRYQIETGSVLTYLWEGQTGSSFEPVEPQDVPAGEAGRGQQSTAACLSSTLDRYNDWLDTFERSMSPQARANGENPE